jgi:ubiquinone/menaquinone biosynthesis C-methylase UbiE
MDSKTHWETIYKTKQPHEVSWFQREARISLELIRRVAPQVTSAVLDVGGGASTLVDGLLASGYRRITVLDSSAAALGQARRRLGAAAHQVSWFVAEVLTVDLPRGAFDVWHDRAVFHFLTAAADRVRYVAQARRTVRPGGHVLVATFAHDGSGAADCPLPGTRQVHCTASSARRSACWTACAKNA